MSSLFRPEAVEFQRQRLYGEVVMTLPITHWAVTLLIAAMAALLVALLFFGSYARKETVDGRLRPDRGVARVLAPGEGVVETVLVDDGQEVAAGEALMTVRLDAGLLDGRDYGEELARDLAAEREQLQRRMDAAEKQFAARARRLRDELTDLERAENQYQRRAAIAAERTALARRQIVERRRLVDRGFLAQAEADKLQEAQLAAAAAEAEIAGDLLEARRLSRIADNELRQLPHEQAAALAALGERLADLDRRTSEIHRRSRVTLTAPIAGQVADLRVAAGTAMASRHVLVDIVPLAAPLQAELFVPSRAKGFLRVGGEVLLRYDAYPYAKFGVQRGRVERIAQTAIDPRDGNGPPGAAEPLYRVIVTLEMAHVIHQGSPHPLTAGMTLKADLVQERRRLGEYLFDSVLAVWRRG